MNKLAGIYQIKNIINNHRYVGSSSDIYHRFDHHKSDLRHGKHHSQYLQKAWDKYECSPKTRKKLSESGKKYWANKKQSYGV